MFIGFQGMQWFTGIVEDRMDPLKQGRVRVRVHGIHTEQKVKDATHGIPTVELLWMHPVQPITSAAMSGVGTTPLGLVEGTQVYGFFRDSFCQDGLVLGSIGGHYTEQPNKNKGFSDPSGNYPRYVGNDVNEKAMAGYPFNHVRESESGHFEEWDDSEGAERMTRYHTTGTGETVDFEGNRDFKVVGSDYELVMKDKELRVEGNVTVVIVGNSNVEIKGQSDIHVIGESNMIVDNNVTLDITAGNLTQTITGNVTQDITGSVNQTVGESQTTSVSGAYNISASSLNISVDTSANITAGTIDFGADGLAKMSGLNTVVEATAVAQMSGATVTLN